MGIYSTDSYGLAQYNVEEAQGYDDGEYSAQIALIEGYQNNLTLFEGAIRCDIQEAAMRYSGVDESEIMVFSENVITSMLGKIKAFIMKVWSKIKAIFRGFMARIDSVMKKSNKEFVNKYRQEVMRKDLTDFEVKWRKPKEQYKLKATNFPNSDGGFDGVPQGAFKTVTWTKKGLDEVEKHLRDWDQDKVLDGILKQTIPGNPTTSASEYEKDFIDAHFEDEETDDKIDIHDVMSALLDFKDTKKNITKGNDSLEKALKQMIKDLESDEKEFNNRLPNATGSDGKYTSDFEISARQYSLTKTGDSWSGTGSDDTQTGKYTIKAKTGPDDNVDTTATGGAAFKANESNKNIIKTYQKAIQIIHKYATCYQEAASKYTAANIKAFKLLNSGLRKVWAKAVAYNRKKDESVMMEAMAELAEYEEDVVYS